MFPADNLAQLQQDVRLAHLRHARRSFVLGPFGEAFGLWRRLYEARATLADQNPAFAATLLPARAPLASRVPGLPLLPAGIRAVVDEAKPATITVSIDVAGPVTLSVTPPGDNAQAFSPVVTPSATRQSTTFAAVRNGLYHIAILAGTVQLAIVYVSVERSLFLRFREHSRTLAFGFAADQNPAPTEPYLELLAAIIVADAAAATAQPERYAQFIALANEIEPAPTPVALFPHE